MMVRWITVGLEEAFYITGRVMTVILVSGDYHRSGWGGWGD